MNEDVIARKKNRKGDEQGNKCRREELIAEMLRFARRGAETRKRGVSVP